MSIVPGQGGSGVTEHSSKEASMSFPRTVCSKSSLIRATQHLVVFKTSCKNVLQSFVHSFALKHAFPLSSTAGSASSSAKTSLQN